MKHAQNKPSDDQAERTQKNKTRFITTRRRTTGSTPWALPSKPITPHESHRLWHWVNLPILKAISVHYYVPQPFQGANTQQHNYKGVSK